MNPIGMIGGLRSKVAVVGAGGVGGAAARFLAGEGHEVALIEQFACDHDRGSSHGESRIIRRTYPDLLYTCLMDAAYPLWQALEQEAGQELFVRTGGIYFGRRGHPTVAAVEEALQATATPYEKLDDAACNARFPGFRLFPGEEAIFQADSGFLRASDCVRANVRLALARGAELLENVKVASLSPDGGGWRLQTSHGDLTADRVLITAGAWAGQLLPELHLPLQPTRQQYAYLRVARHPEQFAPGRFPVWIDAGDEDALHMYGFPEDGRIAGVKFASDARVQPVDPDRVDRQVDDSCLDQLRAYAARRIPDLSGEVTHARTCLYTNTPDKDFIADAVPGRPGVYLVSACSGHGFKLTVLMGRIGADLVTAGATSHDIGRFSIGRFAAGRTGT